MFVIDADARHYLGQHGDAVTIDMKYEPAGGG
jgi:hypothetical protein